MISGGPLSFELHNYLIVSLNENRNKETTILTKCILSHEKESLGFLDRGILFGGKKTKAYVGLKDLSGRK